MNKVVCIIIFDDFFHENKEMNDIPKPMRDITQIV